MNTPHKIIDLEVWESLLLLRDRVGAPLIYSLCNIFLSSTPKRLEAIEKAIEANQVEVVAAESHGLKSVAANLGAEKLSQLCSALEGLAIAKVLQPAGAAIFKQLRDEYEAVKSEIPLLLKDASTKSASIIIPAQARLIVAKARSKNVLIVDDDEFYRAIVTQTVAQVLPTANITVCESYQKAVDLIRSRTTGTRTDLGFDLVISDLNLKAEYTGIDIWKICRVRLPHSLFLLISGTPLMEFMTLVDAQMDEAPAYLPKPFRLDHCRSMLECMINNDDREAA